MGKRRSEYRIPSIVAVIMAWAAIICLGAAVQAETVSEKADLSIRGREESNYEAYRIMTSKVAGYSDQEKKKPIYTYDVVKDFSGFFGKEAYGNYKFSRTDGVLTSAGASIASDVKTTDGKKTYQNVNSTEAAKLASYLEQYVQDQGISSVSKTENPSAANSNTSVWKNQDTGWYLIVENPTGNQANTSAEAMGKTITKSVVASKPILVDLREDVSIVPKDDQITLEKNIVGENGETIDPVKKNNVSIGDTVNYQVKSQIPVYEARVGEKLKSDNLKYILTDTFSDGLTYKKDVSVEVETKDGYQTLKANTDYMVTQSDQQFTVTLSSAAILDNQGKKIVLTYSGVLNENAKVDSVEGNPNDIVLKYSHNWNESDDADYLHDRTITYTYGFKVHKVDSNDDTRDMAGAAFDVKDASGSVIGHFEYGENGEIKNDRGKITISGNYAELKGLDAGVYTLTETKAPKDYALLGSDVMITIADENEATLTGIATFKVEGKGTEESELKDDGNGTIDLVVKIVNVKGLSLPETGAKTMMYCLIIGAVLLAGGAAYFAVRRRREDSAD